MDLSPDDDVNIGNDLNTNDHKTNINSNKTELNLSSLQLLPKIKMRGRPKGAGLTVIRIPREKKIGSNEPMK